MRTYQLLDLPVGTRVIDRRQVGRKTLAIPMTVTRQYPQGQYLGAPHYVALKADRWQDGEDLHFFPERLGEQPGAERIELAPVEEASE